ncbi:protein fem-1 homolog B-like, partial [Ceratina calcarata]|uniref:Protein fem-1 homolog B-like n=1 Tax=Ceratina calcarata TaxID=156304 RepID=A0AAJ7JFS7_9HYME
NVIYKKLGKPVKAYENCKESETVEELHNIRNNENAIHMESLAVRERILGTQNPEVPRHVVFRGILFAESERFDKCIDLWLHALHLKQMNDIPVGKDILRFVQVFSQMIVEEIEIDFAPVLSVLESCVMELANNKSKVNNPDSEMESNIMTTLYILTILTKLLSLKGNRYEMEDKCRAHHLVRRICALQLRLKDGQTLLHLAVNEDTLVDYSITNHVCKYPCAATAKLLIDCGADVNALDSNRNTPLHLIIDYGEPISDFMTINTIIMELIEAGAHMDTVNNRWKTPYDAVTTGVPKTILRTHTKLSLKCMAAKAVKFYDISYRGNVPRCLESFIELHGFDLNQC